MKYINFILKHKDKFFLHYPIATLIALNCLMSTRDAAVFAFLVCVLKELYDKYVKKTDWSLGDMIANVAGIVTALILRLWVN